MITGALVEATEMHQEMRRGGAGVSIIVFESFRYLPYVVMDVKGGASWSLRHRLVYVNWSRHDCWRTLTVSREVTTTQLRAIGT